MKFPPARLLGWVLRIGRDGTHALLHALSCTTYILTPPETAEKHVSFQGAELGGDYLCVTQIAFFVNRSGKEGSTDINQTAKGMIGYSDDDLTISRRSLDFDDVSLLQPAGRRRAMGPLPFSRACRRACGRA